MAFDANELSTPATAQAELVRLRALTPLELVDAAIARIERVNPTLNSIITALFEDAREAAVPPDLPDETVSWRAVPPQSHRRDAGEGGLLRRERRNYVSQSQHRHPASKNLLLADNL